MGPLGGKGLSRKRRVTSGVEAKIDIWSRRARSLRSCFATCSIEPRGVFTVLHLMTVLLALAPMEIAESATVEADRPVPETFLVIDQGCALLGPNGEEIERLESITNAAGAISPDGHWVAFSKSRPDTSPAGIWRGQLIIESRVRPPERMIVPKVWGGSGSSFLPIWSVDSKRMLICEQGHNQDGTRGSAYRVYDLATKSLTELKLPEEWWPSDWSADGRRLLTSLSTEDGSQRVAWVNADGTGKPEFITSGLESAYGARLSPDGQRILCMAGPRGRNGDRSRMRLCVIDVSRSTHRRTYVDEPGETHGYCWSSDGSQVAYTWQRSLANPDAEAVRETLPITCDPDGGNRKTITRRKYEVPKNGSAGGITIFFQVFAWWKTKG
jgi:hypothetical protein